MEPPEIVLDTNVFIAGLRSRRGASFRLLELIGTGRFGLNLSVALALEYEAVGLRHLRHTPLSEAEFLDFLGSVCRSATRREVFFRWRPWLMDPKDDMVLELAVAAGAATVVTFNGRDFRGADRLGVRVCEPRVILGELEGESDEHGER